MRTNDQQIDLAVKWILEAGPGGTMAFSGAGASAESGIATFRDRGGIWDRYDQNEVGTPAGLVDLWHRAPERLGAFLEELLEGISAASPNQGHVALARLEKLGYLAGVATQNIDHLHQSAGSNKVLEIHGSLIRHRCSSCNQPHDIGPQKVYDYVRKLIAALKKGKGSMDMVPLCGICFAPLRPNVVLFTEPVHRINEAFALAEAIGKKKGVVLVVGTAGVVQPAAQIPLIAQNAGAKMIEINPKESSYTESADLCFRLPSGDILPQIVDRLEKMKPLL